MLEDIFAAFAIGILVGCFATALYLYSEKPEMDK